MKIGQHVEEAGAESLDSMESLDGAENRVGAENSGGAETFSVSGVESLFGREGSAEVGVFAFAEAERLA